MVTATAPQTTTSDLREIYFIHTVDGTEVEAIKIGLNPDGSADLSGLAGKRDDLKSSWDGFGIAQLPGGVLFPRDGRRFLRALAAQCRANPYIVFRTTPELR